MSSRSRRPRLVFAAAIALAGLAGAALAQAAQPRAVCVRASAASAQERAMLEDINLVRTNPAQFAEIVRSYFATLDSSGIYTAGGQRYRLREGRAAVAEALDVLRHTEPLPPLRLVDCLSMGAQDHVSDKGPRGATGHVGSDGSQPSDRASRYLSTRANCGESISYGRTSPREHVIALLVDDGVPARGHRWNLLRREYKTLGVGVGTHRTHGDMAVHLMCMNDVGE